MLNKRLFVIAYNNKEWHTVAYIMGELESYFIEGFYNVCGSDYDFIIKHIPKECLNIMKSRALFGTTTIEFWLDSIKKGIDIKQVAGLEYGILKFYNE